MLDFDIKALGFAEVDIEEIKNHFLYSLDLEDWESMRLFDNTEAIFKYLFIDDEDKESIIDTLLDMGKIVVRNLKEGQSVMEYMIENDECTFKLTSGKWVMFHDDLLRKETMAQID